MTIRINGREVQDVRLKAIPVSNVYIGSDLVWTRFVPTAPSIDIESLTQGVASNGVATCVATTDKPESPIYYDFQVEFNTGSWLSIQDSTSSTWNPNDPVLEGFQYRCRAYSTNEYGTGEDYAAGGRISEPVVSGALQTMTWMMTAANAAVIDSAGLEVIDSNRSSSLSYSGGKPRFWFGSESLNYGAYVNGSKFSFLDEDDGTAWYEDNYQVRVRLNDGDWLSCDSEINIGTVYTDGPMKDYNNIGGSNQGAGGSWPVPMPRGLVAGDVFDIEVYTKGELP